MTCYCLLDPSQMSDRRVRVAEACGAGTRIRVSAVVESNIMSQEVIPSTPTQFVTSKSACCIWRGPVFSIGTMDAMQHSSEMCHDSSQARFTRLLEMNILIYAYDKTSNMV